MAMRYARLPGTDRDASLIALGCAWFGTAIPAERAFELLDVFVGQGGNFLDTAHMYASWVKGGAGQSESTIGKWLRTARRSDIVLGTKGADRGMAEKTIREQLDESMGRLQTDYVDFYWLHADNPAVPAGEILEWLNRLAGEGRIRAFGCSNWKPDRMRAAAEYARTQGIRGFAASQIGWSLARVRPEVAATGSQVFMDDETMAYHRVTGMPLVGYSSQAGGFFAGKYDPDESARTGQPNEAILRYYATPENHARLAAVRKRADRMGCTPNRLALACLLNQTFPGFAIVGAGTPEYVRDSCGAADIRLSPEALEQLERGAAD